MQERTPANNSSELTRPLTTGSPSESPEPEKSLETGTGKNDMSLQLEEMLTMDHDELVKLQIFSGISDADAATICSSLITKEYTTGQNILNEGESVQALWIILSGECTVTRSCDSSSDHVLAMLTPGDVFGEMSFVRTAPHSASITAISDVTVCAWHRDDYLKLQRERPEAAWRIASNIAAVLAERLRRMDNWVCDLFARPEEESHRDEWKSFRSAVYTNWDF